MSVSFPLFFEGCLVVVTKGYALFYVLLKHNFRLYLLTNIVGAMAQLSLDRHDAEHFDEVFNDVVGLHHVGQDGVDGLTQAEVLRQGSVVAVLGGKRRGTLPNTPPNTPRSKRSDRSDYLLLVLSE